MKIMHGAVVAVKAIPILPDRQTRRALHDRLGFTHESQPEIEIVPARGSLIGGLVEIIDSRRWIFAS